MSEVDMKRYVVQARFIGLDKNQTKRGRDNEYAIDVVLSDESQYTMFRTLKDIANFHTKLMNTFKVEAGYFKKDERVIPECPVKQSIFGPQRTVRDDKSFGRLLNYYIKEIPALPAALVKSDLVTNFFSLKASDLDAPDPAGKSEKKKKSKFEITDDSLITGPLSLKSYYTVADFSDKKTKFSFKEGATVQVIQKDPSGWWRVDAQGIIGWAPASYLVPVNQSDLQEEAEENEQLIEQERVGTRYISISSYQASRDDELSFVRGAIVKVQKKYVDGWWLVRYNGGEGIVPGAMFKKFGKRQATVYVKKIKRNFTSRGTTRIVPTVKPQWMTSQHQVRRGAPQSLVADSRNISAVPVSQGMAEEESRTPTLEDNRKVKFLTDSGKSSSESDKENSTTIVTGFNQSFTTYVALSSFEGNGLVINKNDNIEVFDDSENDWWFVADTKGTKGWAPADFFSLSIPKTAERSTVPLKEEINIVQLNTSGSYSEDEESIDDLDGDSESLDIEECYVVVKDYTKQSVDELDMFEGQVVYVIDDSDKDQWYVNADGMEGWVPSDVLRLMGDEDFPSSGQSTPVDALSGEVSADNSEMSEDEQLTGMIKRRSHIRRGEALTPANQSDSLKRSPKTSTSTPSPVGKPKKFPPSPRQRKRLQLSDGSDSDVISSSPQVENVTLMENKALEELERQAKEAERQAREAAQRAQELREKVLLAKQLSAQ